MAKYIGTYAENCFKLFDPGDSSVAKLRYHNKFKKALFFMLNEGLRTTFKKHKTISFETQIAQEQNIVVCEFIMGNRKCIGVGKQLYKDRIKKFHAKMVFTVKRDHAFSLNDFSIDNDTLARLARYIAVDECPLDMTIPRMILTQNRYLEPLDIAIDERFLWKPKKFVTENSRSVFIYGFGSYVRMYSLKYFSDDVNSIIDYNKNTRAAYARPDNVSFFEDFRDSLPTYKNVQNPVAIISTYHSSHYGIAKSLFNANPTGKVFVEKPLTVAFEHALELIELRKRGFWFDVGYNRRYIDWCRAVKTLLSANEHRKIITISVKEVAIPKTHWYFWDNQGTRITGNVSHWVDLAYYWVKRKPAEMTLLNSDDSVSLSISFEDGSIANIVASDTGNSLRGVQEMIEIRMADKTIFIDDFKTMRLYENGKHTVRKKLLRDKGHDAMYREFLASIRSGRSPCYEDDDIFWVSYLVAEASKMLVSGQRHVKINKEFPTSKMV